MASISIVYTGARSPEDPWINKQASSPLVDEVLLAWAPPEETEEQADTQPRNAKIRLIEISANSTRAQVLNQLVAYAAGDVCLIVDGETFLPDLSLSTLENQVGSGGKAKLVSAARLVVGKELVPDQINDDLLASTVLDVRASGYSVLAVSKEIFMRLRGFDETVGRSRVAGLDLVRRIDGMCGLDWDNPGEEGAAFGPRGETHVFYLPVSA